MLYLFLSWYSETLLLQSTLEGEGLATPIAS